MSDKGSSSIPNKKAVLLTMVHDVAEIEELAATAGYEIVYEIAQARSRPDPNTFLGRGKIRAVKDCLEESPVHAVILNGEGKPSHHYNLESALEVECVDRVRLVLDIFATRANSKEARLQVERARLQYEMPLLKEWIHSAKRGEHPGFMGGGEYAVDVYYDLIKKRVKAIDDELEEVQRSSTVRRERRLKRGFHMVSLAGYTNAGKSSLMRALTGEEVLIEGRMFSTLSTTTRKVEGLDVAVLLTDTIGFLRDLPPFLIQSFQTTLDEIFLSDLVLLVIDGSEDLKTIEEKLRTSYDVLHPKVGADNVIIIINKIDKLLNKNPRFVIEQLVNDSFGDVRTVAVSSLTGEGLKELKGRILEHFRYDVHLNIWMPNHDDSMRTLSELYDMCEVLHVEFSERILVKALCRREDTGKIKVWIDEVKGGFRADPQ